jgi:hypothetical protein
MITNTAANRVYVDRGYKFSYVPEWMDSMAVVKTSDEDTLWPGFWNRAYESNLFCANHGSAKAVYVIMEAQVVELPLWLSSYRLIKGLKIKMTINEWSLTQPEFYVFYKLLPRGEGSGSETCFGINGAGADHMYVVAFGPEPGLVEGDMDYEYRWETTEVPHYYMEKGDSSIQKK